MASTPRPGHADDEVVSIARRLLTVDDEGARVVDTAQFCELASSCCSANWLDLLARAPPARSRSTENSSPTTLLDEVLLFVTIAQFAPPGTSACDVLHCPVDCEYPNWRSSVALPSKRIHRLFDTCTWTANAVLSAARVIKLVKEPRIRQKAIHFYMELIQRATTELSYSTNGEDIRFFDGVVHLVLIGTTDLWSAIRKDTARAGAKMAAYFPTPELLDSYIGELIPIMSGVSSSGAWTEQEGALLAISELLKSITLECRGPHELGKSAQVRAVDDIRGALADRERVITAFRVGQHGLRLNRLPRGVATSLKPALYRCLQHDQLTIRQTAAECLLAFAFLCDMSMRMAIFQETISKLNRIPDETTEARECGSRDPSLLDAFEAEGLLDVLAKITTALPPDFLVKHWNLIFPTLERYLIHIASNVRQRSSAVILSLAKLSSSCGLEQCQSSTNSAPAEAALSLLIQMLLSLSVEFDTERALCWQKKEGRLLSVDVLVNFLGQDILGHECGSYLSSSQSAVAVNTDGGDDEYRWAHDQLASATWTTDSAEDSSCHCCQGCTAIIRRIDLWITQNAYKHDLPRTSGLLWQQICQGWLAQVKAGLSSVQFELQRISKQVLPRLMRLCIWLDQLKIVQAVVLEKHPATPGAWSWLCGKYLLLHLRYLHECNHALDSDAVATKLTKDEDMLWEVGVRLLRSDADGTDDVEMIVARVETLSMMFAHYTPTRKPLSTLLEILDAVLGHVHAALPPAFQVVGITTRHAGGTKYSTTLDRQFCMSLIRMLPGMTARLNDQCTSVECSHSLSDVGVQKLRLTSCERWLAFERIALTWLSSDDTMRWICVPKATGRFQLLRSLALLVQKPRETMSKDEVRTEFDRIVRHTSLVLATDQPGLASQAIIAEILLSMWSNWGEKLGLPVDEFVVSLAGIYASTQSAASSKKNSPSVDCSASESWDDWDDEETRPASAIVEEDASVSEAGDGGFRQALARLEGLVATRLVTAARTTLARVDARKPEHQPIELLAQHLQERLAQR